MSAHGRAQRGVSLIRPVGDLGVRIQSPDIEMKKPGKSRSCEAKNQQKYEHNDHARNRTHECEQRRRRERRGHAQRTCNINADDTALLANS
jgi:hypothetical protein